MMNSKDLVCDPQSREDIRAFAKGIRRKYGYEKEIYFPIEKLWDKMALDFDFEYELKPDNEFKDNVYAYTDLNENKIYFRAKLFEKAMLGNGFARMTLAHELEHLLSFKLFGIKLYRKVNPCNPAYIDPEWHAKCFAGELLIDYDLTKGMMPEIIQEKCGVSYDAAVYTYFNVHKGGGKK